MIEIIVLLLWFMKFSWSPDKILETKGFTRRSEPRCCLFSKVDHKKTTCCPLLQKQSHHHWPKITFSRQLCLIQSWQCLTLHLCVLLAAIHLPAFSLLNYGLCFEFCQVYLFTNWPNKWFGLDLLLDMATFGPNRDWLKIVNKNNRQWWFCLDEHHTPLAFSTLNEGGRSGLPECTMS